MHPAPPSRFSRLAFRHWLAWPAALLWTATVFAQTDPFEGMTRTSSEIQPRPTWMFFPPNPPPLDVPTPRANQALRNPRVPALPELAEYAGEIFYPQLSSQFLTRNLNDALRDRLSAYRAAQAALRKELREQLEAAPTEDSAARRVALEAFARRQTPKLAQLEQDAEKLRTDLLLDGRHWSAFREWRLNQKERRGFSPIEIAQVMRSYAFFHNNVPLEQRLLLREIAVEMLLAGQTAAEAAATQRYMFFSPTLARVLLPDDIPAELGPKIAAYETKKSALKKELYEAVFQCEGRGFHLFGNPLKNVADKPTAQIAQLEALAGEIRLGLAHLARSGGPTERAPLPPVLALRLSEIVQRRVQLERETTAKLAPFSGGRGRRPVQVTYQFEPDGLHYVVIPAVRAMTDEIRQQVEATEQRLAVIAEEHGRSLAELINARDEMRREVADYIGDKTPAAVDAAMAKTIRSIAVASSASAFHDYRVAVFEPGLSPAQRRLLFQGSIEALDLPLPPPEMQPTSMRQSW